VAGLGAHGIRLAPVLGHSGVHMVDDIRSDRAGEDGRHGMSALARLALGADDGDGGSVGHRASRRFSNLQGESGCQSSNFNCFGDVCFTSGGGS